MFQKCLFACQKLAKDKKKDPVHLFYCDGQVKMVGRNRGDDKNNGMQSQCLLLCPSSSSFI